MLLENTVFHRCAVISRMGWAQLIWGPEARYVADWMRNPIRSGEFNKRTYWLRRCLPAWLVIIILRLLGYDGMLGYVGTGVIAHVFWQKRRNPEGEGWDLHMFSVGVRRGYRRRGFATQISRLFVEYAYQRTNIRAVRIGKGSGFGKKIGKIVVNHSLIVDRQEKFVLGENGWLYFRRLQ